MFPENLAIRFFETNHPFSSLDLTALKRIGRIFDAGGKLPVGNIHAATGNARPGITGPDACSPQHRRTIAGKSFDNACLATNRISLGSQPLRPILRHDGVPAQEQEQQPGTSLQLYIHPNSVSGAALKNQSKDSSVYSKSVFTAVFS